MGLLVNGEWKDQWYDTKSTGGRYVRQDSAFRNTITRDGRSGFPAEAGRYHLYVSYACPWAHRALIFRKLKCLDRAIDVTAVDPLMLENGWQFTEAKGCCPDPLYHARYLHELYTRALPGYTGRVTVPVLWDKENETIVNNESAEIIRMFNREFDSCGDAAIDFCPEALLPEIDQVNAYVYERINNGVYKCGFATTQDAYAEAFSALFEGLDELDARLGAQRYLVRGGLTEADWRLFTTLVRFDAVYVGHFKCNKRRIADYPNLSGYTRELYQYPGVRETVNFDHIVRHYYASHRSINPSGVVPLGPELELDAAHGRDALPL